MRQIWHECSAITRGDPVARYLERRGFDPANAPRCLRLHRALAYFDERRHLGTWPALVAPLTHGRSDETGD